MRGRVILVHAYSTYQFFLTKKKSNKQEMIGS